jgi:hypothetical protein
MTKKEIIEMLRVIKDDIDTMLAYAEDSDVMDYGNETVSDFYDCYYDDPKNLEDVIKSLKEDFKGMKMMEFSKME